MFFQGHEKSRSLERLFIIIETVVVPSGWHQHAYSVPRRLWPGRENNPPCVVERRFENLRNRSLWRPEPR